MFVEVVRRHLAGAPAAQPGWLAALRDPLTSRVLARMHAQPAKPWTLDTLGEGTGASRSTLAEHFAQLVGSPRCTTSRAGACNWPLGCSLIRVIRCARGRRRGLRLRGSVQPRLQEARRAVAQRLARTRHGGLGNLAMRPGTRRPVAASNGRRCPCPKLNPGASCARPSSLADHDLAARAAAGDGPAFATIMRRHNRLLFRTARSILKSDVEAEDALQEAYLRAWRAIDSFRSRPNCRPGWLAS